MIDTQQRVARGRPIEGGQLADLVEASETAAVSTDDEAIARLLAQLASARVDTAWAEFLARYSPVISRAVRLHGIDRDSAEECSAFVSSALADDGFRRLRCFRLEGPARFRTWLTAVVSNLCVDWLRRERGRVRPLRRVSRLPELDQRVYSCIYEQGMSRAQCLMTLASRFPDLTAAQVSEINARLFGMLTPQQRWHLSARTKARHPAVGDVACDEDAPAWQRAAPEPGPDDLAADSQERERLQGALAKLPPRQRLLLRLRYEQDLTLAEVARLTGQPDPFRANREIQAALDALAGLMEGGSARLDRKTR